MTRLERRCRRLLWLLPPDDRATRGEELVGLMCDVSGDRSRPHPSEVLALAWLALRLRFRATRTGLVLLGTALLLAFATELLGNLVDLYTGAVLDSDMRGVTDGLPLLLTVALVPLVTAVAWLFGLVRVALAVHCVTLAYLVATFARSGPGTASDLVTLGAFLLGPVLVLVMLAAAWRYGWAPPRPLGLWLALLLLCVVAWKGVGAWGRHGVTFHTWMYNGLLVGSVVGAAAAAVWLARRYRWQAMTVAAVVGAAVGFVGNVLLANTLVTGIFAGQSLPLALVVLAVGAPVHLALERFRPVPPATPSGSFVPAPGGPSAVPGGR
jgi:hypothetical protein